jgi:hypothetical protein
VLLIYTYVLTEFSNTFKYRNGSHKMHASLLKAPQTLRYDIPPNCRIVIHMADTYYVDRPYSGDKTSLPTALTWYANQGTILVSQFKYYQRTDEIAQAAQPV